jgi:phage-related protein
VLVQLTPLIGQIAGAFGQLITAVLPLLPPIAQLVGTLASQLIPAITPIIPLVGQVAAALAGALLSAFSAILPAITPLLPVVAQLAQALSPLVQLINALSPILTMLATIFAKVVGAVTPFLPPLIQLSTSILPLLISIVTAFAKLLTGDFSGAFETIKKGVVTFGTTIKSAFEKLMTLGRDLVNGIKDGFLSAWNGFINTIKNLAKGAVDLVKGIFGISSPSRVFAEIGQQNVQGLINGMARKQKSLQSMAARLSTTLQRAAPGPLTYASQVPVASPPSTAVPASPGGGDGRQIYMTINNHYPQAEPTSKSMNRGLQYAAAVGLLS